jgi:hypothetical protein
MVRYELRSNTPYIPNFVQKSNRSPIDFESISAHIGSKINITWHQGDTSCANRQYYFCKFGRFALTLLIDTEQNLTRTEVYFGHHNNYTLARVTKEG